MKAPNKVYVQVYEEELVALSEPNEDGLPEIIYVRDKDEFLAGVCVALQVITSMDYGVLWGELVQTAGQDSLLQYAAFTEPDEWVLAGFQKYALRGLGCKKPTRRKV
ncbi:hypothetical protein [Acidithiobacillus ferriphilus]|uniref:hypothetical protein n=1 Tax=Acidithiobacillus ferriphilus TaxID=1689834 RepID=UPI002DB9BD9B|nr:hypothetical protein [Acidithiobacillus ferriphilus]MEB8476705.1 hypothetical protein [Acidithiobacillus ferriphilus]